MYCGETTCVKCRVLLGLNDRPRRRFVAARQQGQADWTIDLKSGPCLLDRRQTDRKTHRPAEAGEGCVGRAGRMGGRPSSPSQGLS